MNAIAAISSPIGAGGIGIVRVSGKDALAIADAVFDFRRKIKKADKDLNAHGGWEPLRLNFGEFNAGLFKDKGYAVYFPAKQAYSGEDTVEFYLHGGVRIMRGALDAIIKKGARLAEKGEFTKLAYLSGRLSLSDAEGVADMINAESAAAVRAAYRLMNGGLRARADELSERILTIIATLEAALDYPEETEDEIMPSLERELPSLIDELDKLSRTADAGRMAKHGITAVLAGEANAGKSSLLNALLCEDRAIVTPIAGTTRDTIEASVERGGIRINFIDTAGLRESGDEIEREGVRRAESAIEAADVILYVIDSQKGYSPALEFPGKLVFTVFNKCDLTSFKCPRIANAFAVSALTGENVDKLFDAIAALYKEGELEGGEILTSERHISAIDYAKRALEEAYDRRKETADCILVDLREAYDALGAITGRSVSEDVVNSVFEKFCVGK